MDIKAQTNNWEPALRITVPTQYSCAYNLWNTYYNKDVFFVCGDGYLWTLKGGYFGSDIGLKKNITPIVGALQKIKKMQGIRFQYREGEESSDVDNNENFRLGFVAQEVEKIFPEVVKDMPDGVKAMSYTDLIAVLVEAIKEQQTQIESLQESVSQQIYDAILLKEQIDVCCQKNFDYSLPPQKQNKSIKQKNNSYIDNNEEEIKTKLQQGKLYDNVPNPFNISTEIKFEITDNATYAQLMICNLNGIELKSYNLTQKRLGNIIIQGSEFAAGIYLYTLLVNNQIVDTKKMILTK